VTGLIYATQPWLDVDGEGYDWFLPHTDPAVIDICLTCTLPVEYCHTHDECYFVQQRRQRNRQKKRVQRLKYEWEKRVEEAAQRIRAATEPEKA